MDRFDVEIDARGLYCPLPIVKLKKQAKTMSPGQVIKLVATDPGSLRDVPSWTNKTGAKLLETREEGGEYTFFIEVG